MKKNEKKNYDAGRDNVEQGSRRSPISLSPDSKDASFNRRRCRRDKTAQLFVPTQREPHHHTGCDPIFFFQKTRLLSDKQPVYLVNSDPVRPWSTSQLSGLSSPPDSNGT